MTEKELEQIKSERDNYKFNWTILQEMFSKLLEENAHLEYELYKNKSNDEFWEKQCFHEKNY